ncbi:MAG: molybdopterin-dependent oxidoreductase [Candidatus Hodarchaeota archaeon]
MVENIIQTVCPRDCYDTCFLRVKVDSTEKIIFVKGDPDNPVTRGIVCPRGAKDNERVFRNRVLYPYIRDGSNPSKKFKKSTWDEVLTLVGNKLQQTLNDNGSEAVLHLDYAGNTGLLTWNFPLRLWNAIGATETDYAICSSSGHEALSLHYGLSYGIQPEELQDKKFIVYWGFNGAVSSIHMWNLALRARRHYGSEIAVIDPRESKSATKADLWLNPRPGSDVALAFGIAKYIIENDYVDLDFIRKWTYGYEQLKEEVMKWTPDRVKKVTGLDWNLIEELGQAYGERKPSATMIGIGFQKSVQGAESVRAVALLPALLGLHRGFFYSNSNAYNPNLSHLTGASLSTKKPKIVSQVALSSLVQKGEFKFIYVFNMNPILTLPDQKAFRAGLSRSDIFVVVHETHWTETTEYADVVLPAPTYLEKDDLVIPWGHRFVRKSNKVINPLGDSKDEIWIMQKLAKSLDLNESWLYEDPWTAVAKALENTLKNGTFDDLMNGKSLQLECKPLTEYQTSTEKIEFYSTKAKELGVPPIPFQYPLKWNEGKFILLNSSLSKYTHTQFQEVYGAIPAIVQINPKDAEVYDIEDEETIILSNDHGKVSVMAKVSNKVPKGILWSPKQLTGINSEPQNVLISGTNQKIGKGPIFNSVVVKILKK